MTDQSRQNRDLEWCIRQSPLVAASSEPSLFPTDEWFEEQSIAPDTLVAAPPPRFRLGIHFEKIFQAWLETHTDYRLAAANLQIQGLNRTIGEFDLLVESSNEIEHWELAIKFYINCESPEDPARWYGPDPKDSLKSKIDRLLSHQLMLGQRDEAIQLLAGMDMRIHRTRCIVKGRLYHPWGLYHQEDRSSPLPKIVNEHHLRGWWLASDEISPLAQLNIAYLDKRFWLSPVTSDDELATLDPDELRHFLANTNQIAPQFVILDEGRNEVSRGFILKPEWFAAVAEQADT